MASPQDLAQWLQEGIAAAKAGHLQTARFRLLDVVEQDQTNEVAWYWLYQAFDRFDDRRTCLENLILLNPDNHWAKDELLNLLEAGPPAPAKQGVPGKSPSPKKDKKKPGPRPVMLKLVTAFWVGISTIFLTSGIISGGAWFAGQLNGQTNSSSPPLFEGIELLIGILFAVAGILGLCVAVLLFMRSMVGFYGSLLLALGLLLIGPTVSLITTPPNYVSMLCTGGISGMIVLLTLAGQAGFEDYLHNDNAANQTKTPAKYAG